MSLVRRISAGFEALRLISRLETVLFKPTGPFSRSTGQVAARIVDGDTLLMEAVETRLARKLGDLRETVTGALWRDVDRLRVGSLAAEGDAVVVLPGCWSGADLVARGGMLFLRYPLQPR